jgi:hypothetical protein
MEDWGGHAAPPCLFLCRWPVGGSAVVPVCGISPRQAMHHILPCHRFPLNPTPSSHGGDGQRTGAGSPGGGDAWQPCPACCLCRPPCTQVRFGPREWRHLAALAGNRQPWLCGEPACRRQTHMPLLAHHSGSSLARFTPPRPTDPYPQPLLALYLPEQAKRSGTVAWSPLNDHRGLLACGTVANAIDDSFETTADLEVICSDGIILDAQHAFAHGCL